MVRALDCGSRGPLFKPGRRYHKINDLADLASREDAFCLTFVSQKRAFRQLGGGILGDIFDRVTLFGMTENQSPRRAFVFGEEVKISIPSNEPVRTETKDGAQNNNEPGANTCEPEPAMEAVFPKTVWLTVDQAVAYCDEQGLTRTPKTVRKWAERSYNQSDGEVVSDREDTLWGRYRWKIETTSLARKVSDELSRERGTNEPVQTGSNHLAQSDEADLRETSSNLFERVRTRSNGETEKTDPGNVEPSLLSSEPVRTSANQTAIPGEAAEVATLHAENRELREQQKRDREEIAFLRDEVTFNRSLKTDFAQTSHRLLETLETLAIGGRLERGKSDVQQATSTPVEPVRYQQADIDQSVV